MKNQTSIKLSISFIVTFGAMICMLLLSRPSFGQVNNGNYKESKQNETIIETVKAGINEYLQKIPEGQETYFGLNNREEFALVEIGKPYLIYTLNDDFFSDVKISSDKNYLRIIEEWRVPIKVNNEYRSLVTVAKMKDTYEIVDFGAVILAKELGDFEKVHPGNKISGNLLRVYQLSSDFVLMSSTRDSNYFQVYPLISAKAGLGINENNNTDSSYSLTQILSVIKNIINNK